MLSLIFNRRKKVVHASDSNKDMALRSWLVHANLCPSATANEEMGIQDYNNNSPSCIEKGSAPKISHRSLDSFDTGKVVLMAEC